MSRSRLNALCHRINSVQVELIPGENNDEVRNLNFVFLSFLFNRSPLLCQANFRT